jgi:hypothetical protein
MRPRTEALVALAGFAVIATLVFLRRPHVTVDRHIPSTFLTDPGGARGLLEAMQRVGIDVFRFRERPTELKSLPQRPEELFAILDPSAPLSPVEVSQVMQYHKSHDLLIAGAQSENIMKCFGYRVNERRFDSIRVAGPVTTAFVHASLIATSESSHVDSTRRADLGLIRCAVPAMARVDTLLASSRGAVMLRLEETSGRIVILVADASLLSNHALRDTDAGPFVLGLFVSHYKRVVFDEYHHGHGAAGSLAGETLEWSEHSPWGWALWQLAGVGVIALVFGAVRFGPALAGIPRKRRSALEHVRALATALSASHGHDEAIGAIVRGLRRRLSPPSLRTRGDWREWLAQRTRKAVAPAEQQALASLVPLTQPGQPPTSVLQAADAVEDLWQSLRH